MSLARCLIKAGKLITPEDRATLATRAAELKQSGMPTADAERTAVEELAAQYRAPAPAPAAPVTSVNARQVDPVTLKHGLDLMPLDTPEQRAQQAAAIKLYKRASDPQYKVDEKRLSTAAQTLHLESDSGTMLRSANPVMRMAAMELLEHGGGAGGRRSSAAIGRHMLAKEYEGLTHNETIRAYNAWAEKRAGGVTGRLKSDLVDGELYSQFGREVSAEIEARRLGRPLTADAHIKAAADSLEGAFERMRVSQKQAKTLGHGALPETSVGYMPHRLDPAKIVSAPLEVKRAIHASLTDQFITRLEFDPSFADKLATKYLDVVNRRALGGVSTDLHSTAVGAVDVVQEALQATGMNSQEVYATLQKYRQGAAKHTKHRLDLDLLQGIKLENGKEVRLLDYFNTDPLSLMKGQAQRVAGEVALTRHGIYGKPGLDFMRRAMEFGGDGEKVTAKELEAFDRAAAEMLGAPVGGARSRIADRALMFTTLARLGGMVWNQGAEMLNGVAALGAGRALSVIPSFGRLRAEAIKLSRGEKIENSLLHSLEVAGGEFGAEGYKLNFPFENPVAPHQLYGQDSLTPLDRLLRGGTHLNGVLSGWRAVHMAQQRGMAEQIVRKSLAYVKAGTNDAALRDMGFSDALMAHLRENLDAIATFDANGKVLSLDIDKLPDTALAHEYVQAVHRGASQIIQGTFVGERGAWAHNDLLRVLLQFRTFSVVSMEKQWTRQAANFGVVPALGIMLGAMAIAAPLHAARAVTNSAGMSREKREKYLEQQLAPATIARATMNYVGLTGLTGDFMDAVGAIAGIRPVASRTNETTLVGNVLGPSVGVANDLWRAVQNSQDGTDIHPLVRNLPFSGLPVLRQGVNALSD